MVGAQHNDGGETFAFGDTNRVVHGLELRWRAFGMLDPETDDHDGDGLSTHDEVMTHGTDPSMPDTDLDGLSDAAELASGTNPLARDTDGDGLPDVWETFWFGSTNATDSADADANLPASPSTPTAPPRQTSGAAAASSRRPAVTAHGVSFGKFPATPDGRRRPTSQ